jgi:hypothetical protein
VAIGLGFGYHLTEIARTNPVIVIEPDDELIAKFHEMNPPQAKVKIITGDTSQILQKLEMMIPENKTRSVVLKTHQPSFRTRPGLYEDYHREVHQWLQQKMLNIITDSAFGPLWTYNCLRNIRHNPRSPFLENRNGSPVLILGSGYTLMHALPIIRKKRDKMILVTIPPALEILQKANIQPDLVVMIDPGYANRYYLQDMNVPLISYCTASGIFAGNWKGPVYYFSSGLPLEKFLFPGFPVLPVSGSVAGTLMEIAAQISPQVLLAGFDFAFVNHYYHYPGNPLEKELFFRGNRLNPALKQYYELTNRTQVISVKNSLGEPVESNVGMVSYYQDFCGKMEKYAGRGVRFYRISEETAHFPASLPYEEGIWKSAKNKDFRVTSGEVGEDWKLRLSQLENLYEKRQTDHPVLQIHLRRHLLKNQPVEEEVEKVLEKIRILKSL